MISKGNARVNQFSMLQNSVSSSRSGSTRNISRKNLENNTVSTHNKFKINLSSRKMQSQMDQFSRRVDEQAPSESERQIVYSKRIVSREKLVQDRSIYKELLDPKDGEVLLQESQGSGAFGESAASQLRIQPAEIKNVYSTM